MGFIDGHAGTVLASYLVTLAGMGGLILWVAFGHRRARRDIARLEREAE